MRKISDNTSRFWNTIEKFYKEALAPADTDKKIYRVFLKRRCFVLGCKYIMKNNIDPAIRETVYSDVGMRVAAQKIAGDFWQFRKDFPEKSPDQFPCRIMVFDDILIYGRSLNRLLSDCEEIFAKTYMKLQQSNSNSLRAELYNIFLTFVTIRTIWRNKNSYLLTPRYQKCFVRENNAYEPKDWRKFCYDIAEKNCREDIPNAAFIPSLQFVNECSAKDIEGGFSACQISNRMPDFIKDINEYHGRRLYTYTAVCSAEDAVQFVLSIRCTKEYMIPFVFLPALTEEQNGRLIKAFSSKCPDYSDILQKKQKEWCHEYLRPVYAELVNMLLSVTLLRAFLQALDDHINTKLLLKQNTSSVMAYNYAHDPDVTTLLTNLFDPKKPAPFSMEELTFLLVDIVGQKTFLFKGISDISTDTGRQIPWELKQRIERRIEKVVFSYGIYTEKRAYRSLQGHYSLHNASVRYFPMPEKNNIGYFLHEIYNYKDSWSRQALPLNQAFAYLFQMMDAGCVALTADYMEKSYVQSLKAGEQSINMLIYRYAEYLPLLNEVQLRCIEQGKHNTEGLYKEFHDFFKACREYGKENNIDISNIEKIEKKWRYYLMYIVWELYNAGQPCSDYMYLVEKKLRKLTVKVSSQQYIKSWKQLYANVVDKKGR